MKNVRKFIGKLRALSANTCWKNSCFLVICFIWPKLTKFLIKSLDKAMSLRNNDPLLISF